MSLTLKKAQRKQVKLKLNLSAPSGGGKTYSALRLAKGLVGDWSKIAVIDTENNSSNLYTHLGDFSSIDLEPPFAPEKIIEAIDLCVKSGIKCIIIDSSTHEWNCLLEENELLGITSFKGNTWAAWSKTAPRHNRFINAVLQCSAHVITCTRSKTETVQEGSKVKKIGIKDMQKEGWEYDFTVSLNIDRDSHLAIASKDRTNLFEGTQPFLITEETGQKIKEWCEDGAINYKLLAQNAGSAEEVNSLIKEVNEKLEGQEQLQIKLLIKKRADELGLILDEVSKTFAVFELEA